jgi:hypothetical protein
MDMRKLTLITVVLLAVLWFAAPGGGTALTQDNTTCPALVEQALQSLGQNCADLPRNTACYGFNQVSATFTQDVANNFFSQPSDRADLVNMESIQTSALNEALQMWGVAVLSVQANIPNTLPGQAARFILLGDTAVNNDVPADEATMGTIEPVEVVTATGANIRSSPSRRGNVLLSVPANTPLLADALSADALWARVTHNQSTVGWMSREVLRNNTQVDTLPIVTDAANRTAMQAFTFTTRPGSTTCTEAPSALIVQGPQNVEVQITANGANIVIGSTILLQLETDKMRLATLSGKAKVDGITVPAGFTVEAPLDENGEAGGDFGGFRPLTRAELDKLKTLEDLPDNILNYPIELPQPPPSLPVTTGPSDTGVAQEAGVECGGFKPTSPLDGLAYGLNTFYWDPAPNATSYRLNIVNVGAVETGATNATYDLYNVGINYQISWYVEALVNGEVACTSAVVTVMREALPPPMSATWECVGTGQLQVSYLNLPPDTTSVVIEIKSLELSDTRLAPPYSGSAVYKGSYLSGGAVTALPSGTTIYLSPDRLDCGY